MRLASFLIGAIAIGSIAIAACSGCRRREARPAPAPSARTLPRVQLDVPLGRSRAAADAGPPGAQSPATTPARGDAGTALRSVGPAIGAPAGGYGGVSVIEYEEAGDGGYDAGDGGEAYDAGEASDAGEADAGEAYDAGEASEVEDGGPYEPYYPPTQYQPRPANDLDQDLLLERGPGVPRDRGPDATRWRGPDRARDGGPGEAIQRGPGTQRARGPDAKRWRGPEGIRDRGPDAVRHPERD